MSKRMFSDAVCMSDAFLDMPATARALYFALCLTADDDGVNDSPKSIIRLAGVSPDDLAVLKAKGFVLELARGLVLIKHWRIHNYLRKDTYHASTYQDELRAVRLKDDKSYTLKPGPKTLAQAVENYGENFTGAAG